jgi:hypothetical protein
MWDDVRAYRHFIHKVLRGVLAERLHDDGVADGVEKHLRCVGPRRLSFEGWE